MTTAILLPDQITSENGMIYLLNIAYIVPNTIINIYLEPNYLTINQIEGNYTKLPKEVFGSRDNMKLLAKRISYLVHESNRNI